MKVIPGWDEGHPGVKLIPGWNNSCKRRLRLIGAIWKLSHGVTCRGDTESCDALVDERKIFNFHARLLPHSRKNVISISCTGFFRPFSHREFLDGYRNGDWIKTRSAAYFVHVSRRPWLDRRWISWIKDPHSKHRLTGKKWSHTGQFLRPTSLYTGKGSSYDWQIPDTHR